MNAYKSTLFFIFLMLLVSACSSNEPQVTFTNVNDGDTVSSPVHLEWGAENFTIEPAGEVNEAAGHLHIMVDTPCIVAGEVVPNDETHLHFGKAQTEVDLELSPGEHTLCLQAADGEHRALAGDGMTQVIEVTVE